MKKSSILLTFIIASTAFIACNNEDKVQSISKDAAVETSIQINHLNDSLDIMITRSQIWNKGILVKSIIHTDTLPSLGISFQDGENSEGETQRLAVPKDYELYLTVK